MKIVYLKPKSGFITELRSDTLWGLICWGIRNVYGNDILESTLETFNSGKPEFIISSAFPYRKNKDHYELFFPKPILPIEPYKPQSPNSSLKERLETNQTNKKNKSIEFVSLATFKNYINGNFSIEDSFQKNESPVLDSLTVIHNCIDRTKGATIGNEGKDSYFFKNEYVFMERLENGNAKSGLYILINGNSEKVETSLRWLNHNGFGGERSTGKGYFDIEIDDFNLSEPKDFNAVTNLSLYFPSESKNEISSYKFNTLFNYKLESRQGYIGFLKYKHLRKPETIMFKEGSTFPAIANHEYYGENSLLMSKDEKSDIPHYVYQYGYGFMIKMKI